MHSLVLQYSYNEKTLLWNRIHNACTNCDIWLIILTYCIGWCSQSFEDLMPAWLSCLWNQVAYSSTCSLMCYPVREQQLCNSIYGIGRRHLVRIACCSYAANYHKNMPVVCAFANRIKNQSANKHCISLFQTFFIPLLSPLFAYVSEKNTRGSFMFNVITSLQPMH